MAKIVVKLGSSIVADAVQVWVREDVLRPVCDQVATRHDEGDSIVLVTSGAIARGMREMRLPMRPSAMDELQAASAVGQGRLYRAYDDLLRARGVQSAQILLTFFDLSARSHYLNARHTLERLLAWNVVPVINENDTTTTDEISFGDNDLLAAQVAVLLGADLLVLLTDTAGLHTADPRRHPDAELVREVREFSELEGMQIGMPSSPLGSGGMRSKVVAAEMATAAGIPAQVIPAVAPDLQEGTGRHRSPGGYAGVPEGVAFLGRHEATGGNCRGMKVSWHARLVAAHQIGVVDPAPLSGAAEASR